VTCDWPIDRTCLPELPPLSDTPTPDEQAAYDAALESRNANEDLAVQVLWALSGRQFGSCPVVVRPCPESGFYPSPFSRDLVESPVGSGLYVLGWTGSQWLPIDCGCVGRCQRSGPQMIHLPGPVSAVQEVVVGSLVLDESEYTLEGDVLYRRGAIWPSQNLGRPMGDPGTWSVTYLRGYAPPAGMAKLVGALAAEFVNACSNGKCRLPRNVTNVARNGVTYQVYNPQQIYNDGKTGLAEVDLWLSAVNPNHLMAAPTVI